MISKTANTFFIPWQDKFIIYLPLKRIVFIGNQAMVQLVKSITSGRRVDRSKNEQALRFLESVGFFRPSVPAGIEKPSEKFNPTVAVLCMTSSCNLRCSYCFANGGESAASELDPQTGMKAIDLVHQNSKLKPLENFIVSFHGGGEPTLPFSKLKKLILYARSKEPAGIIELTSNGFWTGAKADWIIDHIHHLTLSFDGIQAIQDKQRSLANGKGTFNTVMKNIRKLDERKVSYGIRLTVTRDSLFSLVESVKFLIHNTNCSTFQVEPAFGSGRAIINRQTVKDTEGFIKEFLQAYDLATSADRHLYYSGARPWILTNSFCSAHDNALVVTPDGGLSSCYEISGSDHPLANFFHFGSLSATEGVRINFEKRRQFQKKINERKAICKNCFCFWHCAGDCPAKTIRKGDFSNTDFNTRCKVNREITKELLIRSLQE